MWLPNTDGSFTAASACEAAKPASPKTQPVVQRIVISSKSLTWAARAASDPSA
jgi:hypothetical protein